MGNCVRNFMLAMGRHDDSYPGSRYLIDNDIKRCPHFNGPVRSTGYPAIIKPDFSSKAAAIIRRFVSPFDSLISCLSFSSFSFQHAGYFFYIPIKIKMNFFCDGNQICVNRQRIFRIGEL